MKRLLQLSAFCLLACLLSKSSNAQLQLPQPSPKASVTQTVGLTDITIDYSCPGVKNRKIFGDLVPYGKLWRTGANAATKITFSKPVSVGGYGVPEGSYSIFTIPGETEWTLIFNKNATASTGEYKQMEDLFRIQVKPQAAPFRERMAFSFSDFTDDKTTIDLEWDKTKISFDVKVSTGKQAIENIDNATGGTWRIYNSAARYMMDQKNYDKAYEYVNKSLYLADEWFNNWTRSQILAALGKKEDALASAKKAKELGDKSEGFFFKDQVEKAIADLSSGK